jgi:VWFA-related protein
MIKLAGMLVALVVAGALASAQQTPQQPQNGEAFKFKTGVELINVTATVTDQAGRFVSGLTKDDFRVYDDNEPQTIAQFSAERVPVSLGIMLDTSGSMDGEKIIAAREALNRFLLQLLDPEDEVFLYRFDNVPHLLEGWTRDKQRISDAIARIQPKGATSLYDTLAEAVQMAQQGHNKKKAVLIISDGNDTASQTDLATVKQLIRQTEVLVYAIGIDADSQAYVRYQPASLEGQRPIPLPFPFPGGRRPPSWPPPSAPPTPVPNPNPPPRSYGGGDIDRVNVAALRDITDESGGRTEIIRFARDLDPATAGIADELSKQYYFGYDAPGPKDGRWHTIRVEVRQPAYHVRARNGYVDTK